MFRARRQPAHVERWLRFRRYFRCEVERTGRAEGGKSCQDSNEVACSQMLDAAFRRTRVMASFTCFYSFFIFSFSLTQNRHVTDSINNFIEKQKCICLYIIYFQPGVYKRSAIRLKTFVEKSSDIHWLVLIFFFLLIRYTYVSCHYINC